MSQLDLAVEAQVTPRHVSFVESGRARPSREMVLALAGALDVPLRERNQLLLAAGYAPLYRETGVEEPAMAQVRAALDRVLRHHEPFPAVVLDRHWDILMANAAATAMFAWLLGRERSERPANVLRLMFDPDGLRPFVANWEQSPRRWSSGPTGRRSAASPTPAPRRCCRSCSPFPVSRTAGARRTSPPRPCR
jgi:transcriptional regulator with XRE-family HTH domain